MYTGSPSHLNCSCPQGYFSREPGVCEPCALSYYKATIGPEHCLQCPPNSRAMSTGSTSCMCDAGYTPQHSDGIMVARDAQACDGFTPFAGYSPQYPCDSIIGGANAPSQHPGGLCLPCVSGKYKPEAGSMECTECPVGSYRTAAAAVNVTQCAFCPQGRFKLAPGDNGCQVLLNAVGSPVHILNCSSYLRQTRCSGIIVLADNQTDHGSSCRSFHCSGCTARNP